MKMPKKRLLCSICAFLSISFSLGAQSNLSAALCEMASWESTDKAERDSLLLRKAELLESAGESSRAYETLCRIPYFGLTQTAREELVCRKMVCAYEAGMMDEFTTLLNETSLPLPEGKPRHKSEDAAMMLSLIPGAGLAYAGQWSEAGKYFLTNSSIIALGVGAFFSELYLAAFLGGGMLLHATLPKSTDAAIAATAARNVEYLKEYYAPLYESLKQSLKNQGKPEP